MAAAAPAAGGRTFTNVSGASLVGGAGGSTPSVSANFFFNNGGDGLTTSNYVGTLFAATVNNAGAITGGAGGVLAGLRVPRQGSTFNFSGIGTGVISLAARSPTPPPA